MPTPAAQFGLDFEDLLFDEPSALPAAAVSAKERRRSSSALSRAAAPKPARVTSISITVIRRNGHRVPWDTSKIEIAVRKAFLAVGQDSDPAVNIAAGAAARVQELVTQEVAHELKLAEVSIEDVQEQVIAALVDANFPKVVNAYITYRNRRAFERELLREQEATAPLAEEPSEFALVEAINEDGSQFLWDGADLCNRIEFASAGLELGMTANELERELRRSLGGNLSVRDIQRVVVLNAKALMERDAAFAFFAGRILLTYIYEECLGWDLVRDGVGKLKEFHVRALTPYIKRGIELGRLSPDLLSFDLDRLGRALDPGADLNFDFLGIQTLYDRYLLSDKSGPRTRRLETPQMFWMRVAMGIFKAERGDREARVIELYGLYKSRRFCSSTPTLFNSGTLRSQLSSCYLYKIDDSLESIVNRGIAENAMLSKWAGGLGGSWTAVRGTGGYILGTNGESQGVVPFLKMHNDQLVAVNQGGKRAGSGCAYLEVWHNDIFDFLELRKNTGDDRRRTHDMNTANWIPDLFMKRMEARAPWTLFRSNETPDLHDLYGKKFEQRYEEYEAMAARGEIWSRQIEAIELWKRMLSALFETGHPWMTFKDPCNLRSPQDHVGVVHSSNLCTEITLNTSATETAVCNLGSIVLDEHLTPSGELDHAKLRETIRIAVRALDNVIDINYYPTTPAETSNRLHRPIGLGVMGLHFALFRKRLDFGSPAAAEFNDEAMEAIAYYAYEASSDLAVERGRYTSYAGSKWDRGLLPQDTLEILEQERGEQVAVPRGGKMDWRPLRDKIAKQGMRNSNVIAIAPTATISNIMGTSPCIEPMYKNLFVKSNLSGDFVVLNPFMVEDLKAAGVWTKETRDQIKYFDGELRDVEGIPEELKQRYLTAFAIPYEAIVDAAGRRQKWIDQSQSLNLFLGQPDMKTLSHMYRYAWRAGLKTTYYLRTLGASNIEKATVTLKKKTFTEEERAACSIDAMRNGEVCEACQ